MSKAGSSGDGFSYSDREWPKNFPPIPRNRFQKSGNQDGYEVKETKNACVMRVDMPGCPVSSLVYRVEGNNVHFSADEPAMSEYCHNGRKYEGTIVFDPVGYEVNKANAKLINGVIMWLTVPKIPGKDAKINGIEKMLNLKITRDDVV